MLVVLHLFAYDLYYMIAKNKIHNSKKNINGKNILSNPYSFATIVRKIVIKFIILQDT